MAFQVSPGVEVKEIDATNVIGVSFSTSVGGTAGYFKWGPIEEIMTVRSEKELVEIFGAPDDANTAASFLPAAGFLKYASNLQVVRQAPTTTTVDGSATGSTAKNAACSTSAADAIEIKNRSDYNEGAKIASDETVPWFARYAGALGNSLAVIVCLPDAAGNQVKGYEHADFGNYKSLFASAPGTSAYAAGLSKTEDEMHIVVLDKLGLFTGTAGTVLESFGFVSQGQDAKTEDGSSNFFQDVIDNTSQYLWTGGTGTSRVRTHGQVRTLTDDGDTFNDASAASVSSPTEIGFKGGNDGSYKNTDTGTALTSLFSDALSSSVNFLFAAEGEGAADASVAVNGPLITIAATRRDILSFISPPCTITKTPATTTAADLVTYFGLTGVNTSTSYVVADSSALYVYDKYNDQYRYISANGHLAGLCANTDRVTDSWFSPAGQNRGQILGVTKLAYNPVKTDRDTLYQARINPIVSFPGSGLILFGDKTRLTKPSAFDRINVRRLFITLEQAISRASESMLFEFNDEFTRANFRNMVEPFLRDVKGRRGITDFLVICDETNNDGNVVDQNRFVADIFIKPARSINFITLNFIATRTGVEFSEIAGQ